MMRYISQGLSGSEAQKLLPLWNLGCIILLGCDLFLFIISSLNSVLLGFYAGIIT